MDQRIYPHPFIAKEGWPFIAGAGVLALLATALDWDFISFVLWVLFIVVVQFFRDPAREIPKGDKIVLSVVDGRVLKVEKAVNPYTGQVSLLISVFMNLFNVHSQKAPVSGTVLKKIYRPGKYFNAALDKASAENEQCAVIMKAEDGNELTFVQIAGLVTHRILNYAKDGDALKAGDRYGFIRFGSRVDMYLPINATPKVVIGEKVWGTTTVLAVLGEPLPAAEEPEPAEAAAEAAAAEEVAEATFSGDAPEAPAEAPAIVIDETAPEAPAAEPAPEAAPAPAPEAPASEPAKASEAPRA